MCFCSQKSSKRVWSNFKDVDGQRICPTTAKQKKKKKTTGTLRTVRSRNITELTSKHELFKTVYMDLKAWQWYTCFLRNLFSSRLFLVTATRSKPTNSSNRLLTLKHLELIWGNVARACCGKSGSGASTNEQRRMSCSQVLRGKPILVHDDTSETRMEWRVYLLLHVAIWRAQRYNHILYKPVKDNSCPKCKCMLWKWCVSFLICSKTFNEWRAIFLFYWLSKGPHKALPWDIRDISSNSLQIKPQSAGTWPTYPTIVWLNY